MMSGHKVGNPENGDGQPLDKRRQRKRRDGELTSEEVREVLMGCTQLPLTRKKELKSASKLELLHEAEALGLLGPRQVEASLPRRCESRTCYLSTLVQDPRMRGIVERYVKWWSEAWVRGTHAISAFMTSGASELAPRELLDLTTLKRLLCFDRYEASSLPPSYWRWLDGVDERGVRRVDLLRPFTPVEHEAFKAGTLGDQAVTFMARRLRGNLRSHTLTHMPDQLWDLYRRSAALSPPWERGEPKGEDSIRAAMVSGDVSRLHVLVAVRVLRLRHRLGIGFEQRVGPEAQGDEDDVEDQAIAEATAEEAGDDDDRQPPGAFEGSWAVHVRLCRSLDIPVAPLAGFGRSHAVVDRRIAYHLARLANKTLKTGDRVAVPPEAEALKAFFEPSVRFLKKRKRARRKAYGATARRQYLRSGYGRLKPRDGVLKSVQTDGVSASPCFEVPIRRTLSVMVKAERLHGLVARPPPPGSPCACSECEGGPRHAVDVPALLAGASASLEGKTRYGPPTFCKADLAGLAAARRIGVDPGDNNIFASAEVLEPPLGCLRPDPCRETVHQHLSRKRFERRAGLVKLRAWERIRRRERPAYAEAIARLSQAGSWGAATAEGQDAMLTCAASVWPVLRSELVDSNERALLKMRAKRKRRMILDQAATRMVCPKGVSNVRNLGVVVGFGNARWRSRGPRVQLIQAVIRALKTLRREGRPALLVFVDEFNTSKCCHRCFGVMDTPRQKRSNGRTREDRRFRDCPHCGTQAAPMRWGRDSNAALNMLRKLSATLEGLSPPEALARR